MKCEHAFHNSIPKLLYMWFKEEEQDDLDLYYERERCHTCQKYYLDSLKENEHLKELNVEEGNNKEPITCKLTSVFTL
jgi:hypothetical protein